jgi:serine phosphatase RsbU (regulator of sigma subunit)
LLSETQLFPGDTLALYTDGVCDFFNEAGEDFGEQRLIEALRKHRELCPQRMLCAIVDEIRQFSPHEQHDDITMIVAKGREG